MVMISYLVSRLHCGLSHRLGVLINRLEVACLVIETVLVSIGGR